MAFVSNFWTAHAGGRATTLCLELIESAMHSVPSLSDTLVQAGARVLVTVPTA